MWWKVILTLCTKLHVWCPHDKASCVGALSRNFKCCFSEHIFGSGWMVKCHWHVTLYHDDDIKILVGNNWKDQLFTMWAILQHEIRPTDNGKDEFRIKTLLTTLIFI